MIYYNHRPTPKTVCRWQNYLVNEIALYLQAYGRVHHKETEIIKYLIDGFFQVLRPVRKTILRGIVFFVLGWYLDSIRLLKRFKNDSGRVKIRWNFTEIQGVGDLKNTGNEEKCKKIEKKETVCFMPKQLWQMEKRRTQNHFPDNSVREFLKKI